MNSNRLQAVGAMALLAVTITLGAWVVTSVSQSSDATPTQCDSTHVDTCNVVCTDTTSVLANEPDSCCNH